MKPKQPIESLILDVRSQKVMLDNDLAELYGVTTKVFNQAVKRNFDRFPEDFCFRLTAEELQILLGTASDGTAGPMWSQFVTTSKKRRISHPPYAVTEHGAIMAATILNSPQAVAMSVYVVRAFVQMREQIAANVEVLKRLAEIDKTLLKHDKSLQIIWAQLQPLLVPAPQPSKRRIGFRPE